MNKSIIASNLDVHKEQLSDSALYFCPEDPEELANQMAIFLDKKYIDKNFKSLAYEEKKSFFKKSFKRIQTRLTL